MFDILLTVILPIFMIIGVGVLMDRIFSLDLATMSKLNFYVFCPALVFVKIVESDISLGSMGDVAVYTLLLFFLNLAVAGVMQLLPEVRKQRVVATMATVFFNSGNYGLPLIMLAFGNEYLGLAAVIIMVQNLLSFTFGIWLMSGHGKDIKALLKGFIGVPVIYSIVFALIVKTFGLTVPDMLFKPLVHLGNGLIPIALLTLGVQLARVKLGDSRLTLGVVTFSRLLIAPALGWVLVGLLGFSGVEAQVLVVLAGTPVAVNVFILATEYDHDKELASQAVFLTTLLSAVTLTGWLFVVKQFVS